MKLDVNSITKNHMNNLTNTFNSSYQGMEQILLSSADSLFSTGANYLPNIIGALFILILGYFVAKFLKATAKTILSWTGVSKIIDSLDINRHLTKVGIKSSVSELIAGFVYWIVFLTFLTAMFETLGLSIFVQTLNSLIAYLPKVVGAAITVVLALMVGRFVHRLIDASLAQFNINFGGAVAIIAESLVILFGSIIAANQLGFDVGVITANVTLLVGGALAVLVLAIGLGSRTVASNVLGGYYTRQMFKVGEKVTLAGHTGTVKSATSVAVTLTTPNGDVIIPNDVVLKSGSLSK